MTLTTTPRISAPLLTLAASAFLASAYNLTFWRSFIEAIGHLTPGHLPLLAGSFLLIVLLFNAFLTVVSFRLIIKPVLIGLFCVTAVISYFMNHYGVQIDKSMVQNMVETDWRETRELFSWNLVLTLVLLGLLPSLLVWRSEISYTPGRRGFALRAGIIALSLLAVAMLLLMFFKSLAPALREHRELRFQLTPTNYVQAVNGYLKQQHMHADIVRPLGTDAVKRVPLDPGHRAVTLIVVGETARAANFSLNGYGRLTNPELAQQPDLLNFTGMQSCGTATAVSVPCVFSSLGRDKYDDAKARNQHNLLDVLSHAGFEVLWRDNNSGCKGTCGRVSFEDLSKPDETGSVAGREESNRWCVDGECFDERLLENLPDIIHRARTDMVIVLHQKGSHGPAYWKRSPLKYQRFGPMCTSNELESCSRESIVAAYDNSIVYTDHFLNQAIELLKASGERDGVNTAFMYFSDHGESLGEHNLYLHGAPYMISPDEQRAVPFMLWLSEGFRARFHIDQRCMAARVHKVISHDNVFHSVLGMLSVNTAVYNPRLDLFSACSSHV